jgi:hypothetical protein
MISDSDLLKSVLDTARKYSQEPDWPDDLQPDAIQAEADRAYSFWGRLGAAIGNTLTHQEWVPDLPKMRTTYVLSPTGKGIVARSEMVTDGHMKYVPGPDRFKTSYRAFIEEKSDQVSALESTFDKLIEKRKERARIRKKCCGDLALVVHDYVIPAFQGLSRYAKRFLIESVTCQPLYPVAEFLISRFR